MTNTSATISVEQFNQFIDLSPDSDGCTMEANGYSLRVLSAAYSYVDGKDTLAFAYVIGPSTSMRAVRAALAAKKANWVHIRRFRYYSDARVYGSPRGYEFFNTRDDNINGDIGFLLARSDISPLPSDHATHIFCEKGVNPEDSEYFIKVATERIMRSGLDAPAFPEWFPWMIRYARTEGRNSGLVFGAHTRKCNMWKIILDSTKWTEIVRLGLGEGHLKFPAYVTEEFNNGGAN